MNNRRLSAFWGVFFGYCSVAISLVRNVILVPVYLRSIDLPEYGAWLATGGALALLLVNDFGLAGVVTQRASAAVGAADMRLFGCLSGSATCIGLIMAVLLTGVSLACLPWLGSWGALPTPQQKDVMDCFVLAVGANAAGIIGSTLISIIRSLQRSVIAGAIVLFADFANIIATLTGIFFGAGLYAIAGGLLIRALLVAGVGSAAVYLLFRRSLHIMFEIRWSAVRELLFDSTRFFVTSIAMKLQAQANVFFVGAVLGPATAGIYGLTVRAHETVLVLTGQINGALVPSITHLIGSGNIERFREVILRVLLTMAAVTAFAMTVTVTSNAAFLRLWVGARLFAGQDVSIVMAAALFLSSLGYVAYDALIAQGRFRLVSAVFAATSTLHVVLLMSVLHWGLWAAPLVTLTTAAIWGLVFWRNLRNSFALTAGELRGLVGQLAVLIAVSVGVGCLFMVFYPGATSWPGLVTQAILCMLALVVGYGVFSATFRNLAREEIGLTIRLFSSS